jgi:hypothetical protein
MLSRAKLLVLAVVATVVVLGASGAWIFHRLHRHSSAEQPVVSTGLVKFPFSLPCSSDSRDAGLFYGALRHHDRAAVIKMLSENKVHLIRKGIPVDVLDEKPFSIVTVTEDGHGSVSCFVPADDMSELERKAYK